MFDLMSIIVPIIFIIVIGIIVFSVLPMIIEIIRHRMAK